MFFFITLNFSTVNTSFVYCFDSFNHFPLSLSISLPLFVYTKCDFFQIELIFFFLYFDSFNSLSNHRISLFNDKNELKWFTAPAATIWRKITANGITRWHCDVNEKYKQNTGEIKHIQHRKKKLKSNNNLNELIHFVIPFMGPCSYIWFYTLPGYCTVNKRLNIISLMRQICLNIKQVGKSHRRQ